MTKPMTEAAEAWRQWLTGSLVRMQDLDDTEQALLDALALARCGQCRQCDDCRRDAPFAERPERAWVECGACRGVGHLNGDPCSDCLGGGRIPR